MSEEVMNTSTVNYSFSGSGVVYSGLSNISNVTLKDENSLIITKEAQSSSFIPGETLTYVLTISNGGSSYFTGVRIVDDLGGNGQLSYIQGSAMLYYYSQYIRPEIASTNPLTFTLSPLSPGQTMILTYSCKVSSSLPGSVLSITNSVVGTGYTYNDKVTTTASCEVQRSSMSELSIVKSATASSVSPGEVFSYNITLTNQSSTQANVSSVTDSLPSNFVVSSVKLKVGNGGQVLLNASDYILDQSNNFTLPSNTGPQVIVPAYSTGGAGQTVVTITGYLQSGNGIVQVI